ncbi:MAG TPA: hypothetical protein ENJ95_16610 [Bacteroidetes bacterium]|nr:hypothetical protein [Bacteroidota bacterium]
MQKTTILILSLFFSALAHSQTDDGQRFKAGIIAGLNASQILGDESGGYNRLGLTGGLRAITVLTEKTDLIFEILYSQRGSYDKLGSPTCFNGAIDISTKYVEVPVVATFKDWLHEEDGYYRIQVSGGFSYSRLISASAIGTCHDDLTDLFNTNDVSYTLGVEYFSSEHLSFGMRWSRSFNLLYNREKGLPNRNENSLRGFFLSFRGAYIF